MNEISKYISTIIDSDVFKIVISKPKKSIKFRKIIIVKKSKVYQVEKYTEKQVFHKNIVYGEINSFCTNLIEDNYMQVNAWDAISEHILIIGKKGELKYKKKLTKSTMAPNTNLNHNRKKNYILQEGMVIPPLVDMGVLTKEGKVIKSMSGKFKQINRFCELIDDSIKKLKPISLNIIDFGCGKSYLTFVLYYYLTEICKINVSIVGLDLKKSVIDNCNTAADKYGYSNLNFELGDINGYETKFKVDMVISLHACDTATDYALFNAIKWDAKMIFSVPCCQHELNKQIVAEKMSILTRYGIIQERFASLLTDALRSNILEVCGYKTQLVEFVDFSHTPKNILIRAIKKDGLSNQYKNKLVLEINNSLREFNVEPKLLQLIKKETKYMDD